MKRKEFDMIPRFFGMPMKQCVDLKIWTVDLGDNCTATVFQSTSPEDEGRWVANLMLGEPLEIVLEAKVHGRARALRSLERRTAKMLRPLVSLMVATARGIGKAVQDFYTSSKRNATFH